MIQNRLVITLCWYENQYKCERVSSTHVLAVLLHAMAHPTPLKSFLGGLTLPIPVHSLLLLNGNVFGISGFVHRAARGGLEGADGTLGLVLGGILVSLIDTAAPATLPLSLSKVAIAGLLVGLGTKVRTLALSRVLGERLIDHCVACQWMYIRVDILFQG